MKKKYNKHTRFYKIDVYYNKEYQYSTDSYRTCKEAKERFIEKNPTKNPHLVTANFDRQ